MGDSLQRLRDAPAGIRADAGYQLKLVQAGELPADYRPMPDVGPGVLEIRLSGTGEYRVFYVAKFEESVYVLHCFDKKSRATRKTDIDLGRVRYKEMLARRRAR
ncbi:MAG: type II toxin-antitoxin system RelE/ParE family toxin [Bryobacteraceae bacterium]|nr:type II toxin-antitoxin system RelE/ParE family toxin [Bryobacteraceae bacterium]